MIVHMDSLFFALVLIVFPCIFLKNHKLKAAIAHFSPKEEKLVCRNKLV